MEAKASAAKAGSPYLLLVAPFLEAPSSMPDDEFRQKYERVSRYGTMLTPAAATLGALLGAAPEALRRRVLAGELRNLSPQYVHLVLRGLISGSALRNVLSLATSEFAALRPSFDFGESGVSELAAHDRLRAVFLPEDMWAPLAMRERCIDAGVRADYLESSPEATMRHAFSVQRGSCAAVAEWAAQSLADMSGLHLVSMEGTGVGGAAAGGGPHEESGPRG